MISGSTKPQAGSPIAIGGESFVVELDRFQGPLDLLLHLIRSQDIDILDIPIAHITGQFLRAIEEGLDRMPLERAGEFLEMSATLVRIKAQMLLPRPERYEWEEDPRAELVRRLLEYEHFQDVVHVLQTAEAQRGRHMAKGYIEDRPPPVISRPQLEVSLRDLLEAAARIPDPVPVAQVRPPSATVTVGEKVSLLRRLIGKAKRVALERLFKPWGTRAHAVAALLAALELARQQVIRIEQTKPFSPIWLFSLATGSDRSGSADTGADGPELESSRVGSGIEENGPRAAGAEELS
ncbi:MAG: segregation/condensation protein A [marine benthic group bacterium]|jgi:segregation and condensation protein A|nr:segregation/condensation protein A [Gemmatimonadota bacterium]MCL7962854.1 segregation/condensation protein A [Candidatus Carthagonibacter metallireducens]MCL7938197.1 segregation/condensation protein A [Gemmatimonadota bacterium]MCL7956861.1 segregation/condensation protein A [Gemmatimonadota bacterium]MCL7967791.1 segregation/condensation protein A [Gemmatimonadota bacterium]